MLILPSYCCSSRANSLLSISFMSVTYMPVISVFSPAGSSGIEISRFALPLLLISSSAFRACLLIAFITETGTEIPLSIEHCISEASNGVFPVLPSCFLTVSSSSGLFTAFSHTASPVISALKSPSSATSFG